VPGATAHAEIGASDGRLLRVQIEDLAPGQDLTLQLTDLAGRNGAPAPDRTIALRTPPAVELTAINGTPPDASVPVPLDTPIALEWSAPVRSVRYRVGDTPATWTGAPTTRVELPLALKQGQSRTLDVDDAVSADGGWLPAPESLELIAPAPLRLAAFWPASGATAVSPQADPTFRFTEPIADRAAAEAAISFDPPVPGRFEWLAPNRAHFIPETEFPHEAEIKMSVQAGPGSIRSAAGSYLIEPLATSFQTGKLKVINVSLSRQVLTLFEDDQPVWSAPVATGVKGADTPPGTYQVQYKMPVARFRGVNPNGSRYDIPDVHWVLAFFEDYTIHGAYWRTTFGRPGSNGCISLTDPNAKVVFDWADVGTRVVVRS